MKRNLILTLIVCGTAALLTGATFAQTAPGDSTPANTGTISDDGPGGGDGGHLLQRLTYALGLTGSQQAAIAPIINAAKPQLKAIREQAKTARDGVINSVSTQITPLLSGTQQARFAEMVHNLEAGPGPGGPMGFGGGLGGPGHAHPGTAAGASPGGKLKKFGGDDQLQHLTTALDLTPEEQAQIKPILQAAHAQVQAILTNTSLAPQQKFTQAKAVLQAANGQINGILTPAQQTQFAALKEERLHRKAAAPAASPSPSPAA
jgi:Spy/CpxP family protein refolding chaperone